VNTPIIINGFGDYERNFGKLHPDYPMSYAGATSIRTAARRR
jgi:hypothetical protein